MSEGWTEILRASRVQPANEAGLVLTAVGVACLVAEDGDGYALYVQPADVGRAHEELGRYVDENRPAPVPPEPPRYAGALRFTAAVLAGLFLISLAASRHVLQANWLDAGALDADAVRAGAWWRTITALTLHANAAHLASNVGFGLLFGAAAASLYGPGVGWLAIFAAAGTANLLEAYIVPVGSSSIGASTAVFAALGLIAARAPSGGLRRGLAHGLYGAVIAAALLLAFVGTGDEHTDINGHALGFACGLALGLALRPVARFGPRLQRLSGITLGLIVTMCWGLALAVGR